jgi:hypothetical protein
VPKDDLSRFCTSIVVVEGAAHDQCLERADEKFRRPRRRKRVSWDQDAVLLLLFGWLRSGQIQLQVLDRDQDLRRKAA